MLLGFGGRNCRVFWQLSSTLKWIRARKLIYCSYSSSILAVNISFFFSFYSALFVWKKEVFMVCMHSIEINWSTGITTVTCLQTTNYLPLCTGQIFHLTSFLFKWEQCRVVFFSLDIGAASGSRALACSLNSRKHTQTKSLGTTFIQIFKTLYHLPWCTAHCLLWNVSIDRNNRMTVWALSTATITRGK